MNKKDFQQYLFLSSVPLVQLKQNKIPEGLVLVQREMDFSI